MAYMAYISYIAYISYMTYIAYIVASYGAPCCRDLAAHGVPNSFQGNRGGASATCLRWP